MVDWQMSRFGSFIVDLHYIIFTSIEKNVLRTDFHAMMDHYHAALGKSIQKLGSDPAKLYPYDAFKVDVKRYNKFALSMALVMAQVFVAENDDLSNLDEIFQRSDGNTADFVQKMDGDGEKLYKQRIRDTLDTFLELNLYWN